MPIINGIPTYCKTCDIQFSTHTDALIHVYEDDIKHTLVIDIGSENAHITMASPDEDKIEYA